MCSSPHWQVCSSWFHEKLTPANGNKGFPGEQISRKLSPAYWMQGVTAISRKISHSWAPRLQNLRYRWAKKWGPTCDRDISNSVIQDRDISGVHCTGKDALYIETRPRVLIPPPHSKVVGAVYWFHSVRPFVCPASSVRSEHLQLWLDPFHIYTSYQATSGVSCVELNAKFEFLAIFKNL